MLESRKGFSSNTLKLIAITAMLIDHIGAELLPEWIILRVIGRLTMPIMAYLLTVGFQHTHHFMHYQLRLLIFAIIAAVPYTLYFGQGPLNILFTLWLSLWCLKLYDSQNNNRGVLIIGIILLATFFNVEGAAMVITIVLLFHIFSHQPSKMAWAFIILNSVYLITNVIFAFNTNVPLTNYTVWIQFFAVLALPFILKYNGTLGKIKLPRYLFYVFYPAHLTVLLLFKLYALPLLG